MTEEEQEVLKLNDPVESYWYCRYNKDKNVKLHEDVIVNNKNAEYAYYFAKDIPGANIEKLQEVVINYGDNCNIYHFAYYIDKSNKEELFIAILKLVYKDYINLFIKNIPLSQEIKKLQEVVINYGNLSHIYFFAKYVEKSNKEELFKAILKTGNEHWISKFIKNIELSQELKELVIFI